MSHPPRRPHRARYGRPAVRRPTGHHHRRTGRRRPRVQAVRRRLRRELGWLLAAAGVAGLVLIAIDVWTLPGRHRWDGVAAAVVLIAGGLHLLTHSGPSAGPG